MHWYGFSLLVFLLGSTSVQASDNLKSCNLGDFQTPILPPIPPDQRPRCEQEPDLAQILGAMKRVEYRTPHLYEVFRDDFTYVNEKILDRVEPPRFFPLIGPAQLHHSHWKCTVLYTETLQLNYPFSILCKRRLSQIIFLDRCHLHSVACPLEQMERLSANRFRPSR